MRNLVIDMALGVGFGLSMHHMITGGTAGAVIWHFCLAAFCLVAFFAHLSRRPA